MMAAMEEEEEEVVEVEVEVVEVVAVAVAVVATVEMTVLVVGPMSQPRGDHGGCSRGCNCGAPAAI